MEAKKRCLSCGTCNKVYCFLLLGDLLVKIGLISMIFGFNNYNKEKVESSLNILLYIFLMSLTESLMIIPDLLLRKSIFSKKNESNIKQKTNLFVKHLLKKRSINFSLKEKVIFLLFGLLKLILDFTNIGFNLHIKEEEIEIEKILFIRVTFKFIFLFLLSIKMYNVQFYRHQYLSIFILTLFDFSNFFLRYHYMSIKMIIMTLLAKIFYSFSYSLFIVYIKGLMEYKYVSPYKACYIYGFINLFISTLAYIITSLIPCNKDNEACNVIYNEKHYYANILAIFTIHGLFWFIMLLLYSIITVINYIIIYKFSTFHSFIILIFGQIFYLFYKIGKEENNKKYLLFIIALIATFFNIFFILLFLEIIEINICGISYNTSINIESRAISEIEFSIAENKEYNCEEEKEEEIEEEKVENQTNN